jgi:branched-chain amino acid aminotransferase
MTVILDSDQALAKLQALPRPWSKQYLAMYSSLWQGIITEPWLMMLPIDDHMAHRGDGVFEACKCVDGAIYELDRHLERLFRSAEAVQLQCPLSFIQIKELAVVVTKAGNLPDCLLRVYLSRGPGSLNANPLESVGAQIYILACTPHAPSPEAYTKGVRVGFCHSPVKMGFMATIKSCSYLPNVLAKLQALSRGWDYPLWTDPQGVVGEGSTENFVLLDQEQRLIFPDPSHMVEGITVRRVQELAAALVDNGLVKAIAQRLVSSDDVLNAREIMIISTSINVLPATVLNDRPVGDGRPGPVSKALLELLQADIAGKIRSTQVF